MAERDAKGRIMRGSSGNPSGRARGLERMVREACEGSMPEIIKAQIAIACGRAPEGLTVIIEAVDITRSASWLSDRGWGKPKETVEIVEPAAESHVDWSLVPLDDRKRLLAALDEVQQLAATSAADESAEH